MNVVVLAGGLSTERDVSLKTGRMVGQALKARGHSVVLLDVFLGYAKENAPDAADHAGAGPSDCAGAPNPADLFAGGGADLLVEDTGIPGEAPDIARVKAMRTDRSESFFGPGVIPICQEADIVFMALHGENGENGKVQAAFDLYGIRYTGAGYLGSALAMDKGITKTLYEAAGIPTPRGVLIKKEDPRALAETGIGLPCIVKPNSGGSSIGVSIVRTADEYDAAMAEAFQYENEVVVEEFVTGREFSVGVLGETALPVIEVAPKQGFYDYRNKYEAGSTVETCPADLPEEISDEMRQTAVRACHVLGLTTYSRTDFLLDGEGRVYCLESNTLPGMTPTSLLPQEAAVVGMDFEALCEDLIRISMAKYL